MKRKKIVLVVDDEHTMQKLIMQNLSRSHIPILVYGAATGEEGAMMYRTLMEDGSKPDVVIMDVNLTQWGSGKIDGVEATRQIMTMDPDATILGYTAYFTYVTTKDLMAAGAKEVIERVIRPSEFRKIVEGYLNE